MEKQKHWAASFEADDIGQFSHVDAAWGRVTGQTVGATLGFGWLDVLHDDDRASLRAAFDSALRQGAPFQAECRLRHSDGAYRWVLLIGAPRFDEGGAFRQFTGFIVDIDARRAAEAALRKTEEREAFLLRLADALRPLGDPVQIQDAAARLLGEQLGADRTYYAEIDETRGKIIIERAYARNAAPSVIGEHDFAPFQIVLDVLRAGRAFVADDVAGDPSITPADVAAYHAFSIRGVFCAPLLKDGRLRATMTALSAAPRHWTSDDVFLITETAERTWAAVERAQAEANLRKSQRQMARDLADAKRLQAISSALVKQDDAALLHQEIMQAAMTLMQSDAASLQMYDSEQDELHLLAWKGFHPDSAAFWERTSLSSGSSCSHALRQGRRLIATDVEDAEFAKGTQSLGHWRLSGIRSVQSTPLFARDGRLIGAISTHWRAPHEPSEHELALFDALARQAADMLERQFALDAQRESALRYQALFERTPDGVVTVDMAGRIIDANPAYQAMLGYSLEELKQLTYRDLTPERWHAMEDAIVREQILPYGRSAEYDKEYRRENGVVFPVSMRTWIVLDARGNVCGMQAFVRDITERKAAELALKEADRRKDDFLATLAHELRNPLAPIRNAVHVMRMKHGPNDADAATLDMVQRQVDHLVRLVDELLEISRINQGKIDLRQESVPLSTFLRDALESCQPLIDKKGHRVTTKIVDELWVSGDSLRLAQIATNLVNNAAKYTPPGGVIVVEGARDGDEAVLRIRDNGVGIAADMLPRVFDLFAQIDRHARLSEGGLGIGLALVRKLVELHGGRIAARSDGPGSGSEFIVWLPLAAAPAPAAPGGDRLVADGASSPRALVIDDDRDVGDSVGLLLESLGATVRVVYDGLSGVDLVNEFDPDLIFLDVGMPRLDGYETARRIRKTSAGKRPLLVALTGWGQVEDRRRTQEAGFDAHLTKPASVEAIQALLRSVR
ncbi:PAS domain S-box protein [Methylocystis echinoides]|uniref:PAS domain S-box protein n=1 Tax=Methylocystis echinoides TaxID=29468 RepID=UPI003434263E